MKQLVIMPGGFHPFHAGHLALYQSALEAFPGADVKVAATNDTSNRPFPFRLKEKLAQLAGVPPGDFYQVKSPFRAEEITKNYDPEDTQLIFVRSEKDADKPPRPGGILKNGSPAYLQPVSRNMAPMTQHAYMAYLPTVTFGPGMRSATEIRTAWPSLDERRRMALVMSLYPNTQKNPKLAKTVVRMLDTAMGAEVAEATGDERFDTLMGRMQKEPRIPDSQMPPTDVKDLYHWAVENHKPYHKIFAHWANREGFKSVAQALQKAGNLDSDALDYWTPDVWKLWYGPDAEMPRYWSKERVPDELRDYLEGVFDAYNNIVFDWPTEYRQIGEQGVTEGWKTGATLGGIAGGIAGGPAGAVVGAGAGAIAGQLMKKKDPKTIPGYSKNLTDATSYVLDHLPKTSYGELVMSARPQEMDKFDAIILNDLIPEFFIKKYGEEKGSYYLDKNPKLAKALYSEIQGLIRWIILFTITSKKFRDYKHKEVSAKLGDDPKYLEYFGISQYDNWADEQGMAEQVTRQMSQGGLRASYQRKYNQPMMEDYLDEARS